MRVCVFASYCVVLLLLGCRCASEVLRHIASYCILWAVGSGLLICASTCPRAGSCIGEANPLGRAGPAGRKYLQRPGRAAQARCGEARYSKAGRAPGFSSVALFFQREERGTERGGGLRTMCARCPGLAAASPSAAAAAASGLRARNPHADSALANLLDRRRRRSRRSRDSAARRARRT